MNEKKRKTLLMMAVLGRETNLLLSLSFSAPCTVSFLPHIALRLGFPSWLPNVFLYKQDKRAEGKGMSFVCWCHKLMWTLPALDIVCLVVYTPRVLGITKAQNVIRHPHADASTVQKSPLPSSHESLELAQYLMLYLSIQNLSLPLFHGSFCGLFWVQSILYT